MPPAKKTKKPAPMVTLRRPEWAAAALQAQARRCLARTCGGLGRDDHLTDCALVLDDGNTLPAHRAVLARSRFLRKLLRRHNGKEDPAITFKGYSPATVAKMIRFLYTGQASEYRVARVIGRAVKQIHGLIFLLKKAKLLMLCLQCLGIPVLTST
jgi:hypothetical protein